MGTMAISWLLNSIEVMTTVQVIMLIYSQEHLSHLIITTEVSLW